MENTKGDGYVTEKIIHSLCAGTIPIYYIIPNLEPYII